MTTVNVAQGSPEWFALRRGLPTASRFDQIITPGRGDPSASQTKLIDALIAESLLPLEEVPSVVTADMMEGIRHEARARCGYELGFATSTVTEVGFILHESGKFGGSPDAICGDDGGVEIKVPTAAVQIGYIRAGVLPLSYKTQVHGYLAVTGRKWWDFYSHHTGLPPFCVRIHRDEFTAKLAAELDAFCEKYNRARIAFDLPPFPLSKP